MECPIFAKDRQKHAGWLEHIKENDLIWVSNRRTGRTTRMLEAAFAERKLGANVLLVASLKRVAERFVVQLAEMAGRENRPIQAREPGFLVVDGCTFTCVGREQMQKAFDQDISWLGIDHGLFMPMIREMVEGKG